MQTTYRMRGRYDLAIGDYKPGDVVQYDNDRYYVFRRGGEFVPLIIDDDASPWNEAGPPGESIKGDKGDKGDPGNSIVGPPGVDGKSIVFKGEWQFSKQYYANDVVTNEGSSFIAIKKNKANEPSEFSDAWHPLASKGADGKDSFSTHLRTIVRRDESQSQLVKATFSQVAKAGQAVYVVNEAGDVALAKADNLLTARAIGLAAADGSKHFQADGIIELSNWQNVIGAMHLEPARYYYLSPTVAGQLTPIPPHTEGQFVVQVGQAVSRTKLALSLDSRVIEL